MRQLSMRYHGSFLKNEMPCGLSLRTYDECDREKLKDVLIPLTIERYADAQLDEVILRRSGVRPEGVFLADLDGNIAATATGYTHENDNGGTLHMVSALPEAKGRGAGSAVCRAAVNYLIERGCDYVDLTTDDFRLPAIVIYTRMGFRPVVDDDEMRERWTKVYDQLGMNGIMKEAYDA